MNDTQAAKELVAAAKELSARPREARSPDVYFIAYPERGGRKHYRIKDLGNMAEDFTREEITALSLVVGGAVVEDFDRSSLDKILDEVYE